MTMFQAIPDVEDEQDITDRSEHLPAVLVRQRNENSDQNGF